MQVIKKKLSLVYWLALLLLPLVAKGQELVVTPVAVVDCNDPAAIVTLAPDEQGRLLLTVAGVKDGDVVAASWKQGGGASQAIPGMLAGGIFSGEAFTPALADETVYVSVTLSHTALYRLNFDAAEASLTVLAAGSPTTAASFSAGTPLVVMAAGHTDNGRTVTVQRIEVSSADGQLLLSSADVSAAGTVSVAFDMPASEVHIRVLTTISTPDPGPDPEPDPEPDPPTAVETPSAADVPHAAGAMGELLLTSSTAVKADVYNIGGYPVVRGKTVDGSCRIALDAGFYIVRFAGGPNVKVLIR